MEIKAVKFRDEGFYTQPFVLGGEEGKTTKSILVSCGARLAPFDIKELREITACKVPYR